MVPLDRLDARRIALLKPSALGDIVHTLPVLSALRARFPRAHLTWVVNHTYEALLSGHPDLTDTRRFDLVIDMQGLFRSGVMTWLSGAPRRVGFRNAREGSRYAYTDKLKSPGR